jgi:ribokinase
VTPRVVVVGSVNLDLVVRVDQLPGPGETVTGGSFFRSGGGKGANQALAARKAGADVWLIAEVGADEMASEALADLDAAGVDLTGVFRSATAPTGVALITVDRRGENMIAVASGANAELGPARVEEAMRLVPDGGVVVVNFEIPDETLLAAAASAARTARQLVVNPAPARPAPDGLEAMRPLLTPNRDEAAVLAGIADPTNGARLLAARTGSPVVVTLGADGAILFDGGTATELAAPSVVAVDSTGAGDVFTGALAARLAAGQQVEAAVRWAVIAASLSTARPGARAAPDAEDVEQWLAGR